MIETNTNQKKIVLSAGGTGGHIYPAFSLKEELIDRGYECILFTDKRGIILGRRENVEGFVIDAASPRKNPFLMFKALFHLGIGFLQSWYRLRKLKPCLVIGFGGYPTVPTLIAAKYLKIPIMIHEQNGFMGMANHHLAKFADRIALSFSLTKNIPPKAVGNSFVSGMPVRRKITALHGQPYEPFTNDKPVHLVVIGGSLGASIFAEVIPKAFEILPSHYTKRLKLTLQVREPDIEKVRKRLEACNVSFELSHFFTNIPQLFSEAHLIISRAGASTLAEIACAGKPAILVPFPGAQDNHQYYNALNIEKKDAAWVIPEEAFTGRVLASRLEALFNLPSILKKTADASHKLGDVNAAKTLADEVEKYCR